MRHTQLVLLRRQAVIFVFVCAFSTLVKAQQPFVTDDADTTPNRKFHLQFANEFDILQRSAFPTRAQNTAVLELDYGLTEEIELGISVPHITLINDRDTGARAIAGVGDANLSLKYNFLREKEGARRPALAVTVNLELPTGSVRRGLGSGLSDFSVNGIAQKSLGGKNKLRFNGGILFSGNETTGALGVQSRGKVLTGGVSFTRDVHARLTLGGELTGAFSRNAQLGKGLLQTRIGGNFTVRQNLTLDFAAIAGKMIGSPRVGALVGFSYDFE